MTSNEDGTPTSDTSGHSSPPSSSAQLHRYPQREPHPVDRHGRFVNSDKMLPAIMSSVPFTSTPSEPSDSQLPMPDRLYRPPLSLRLQLQREQREVARKRKQSNDGAMEPPPRPSQSRHVSTISNHGQVTFSPPRQSTQSVIVGSSSEDDSDIQDAVTEFPPRNHADASDTEQDVRDYSQRDDVLQNQSLPGSPKNARRLDR